MKKYYALFYVELYLISTLLLLCLGPVHFKLHNQVLFWSLIFLYHSFFACGYIFGLKKYKNIDYRIYFSPSLFYFSLSFGLIAIFLAYINLNLVSSFDIYDYFRSIKKGLSDPDLLYVDRMVALAENGLESKNRLINFLLFFFAFFKYLFIFYAFYFWKDLNLLNRLTFFSFSLLFISTSIAAGVNSQLFLFSIFSIFSWSLIEYIQKNKTPNFLLAFLLFVPAFSYFAFTMSKRGGDTTNFEKTSPLGDINVTNNLSAVDNFSFLDSLAFGFQWFNYYLVQGYYSFSLILDRHFDWTYGFGNSAFLQRQFNLLTNIDIYTMTYQYKIENIWGKDQWHSFYGQFANDFGLFGLVLLMFFLGFLLARIWCSVIYYKSFFGMALIPIFAIMIIFFPANNQVFGYIDTLSFFVFIFFLWLFDNKKVRFFR
jgi:hypothetical protein